MITAKQISDRKRKSGGQAIVMVSLSLIAMSGMMGLAVDLGWSFYVQREAQAAADGAALAAVQAAYKSMQNAPGGDVTAWSTCGNSSVDCQTAARPTPLTAASSGNCPLTNNLKAGCAYSSTNCFSGTCGFADGGLSGRQHVYLQANKGSVAPSSIPTPPGPPANMIYWVTATTWQTVPQLFSAIMGNPQGIVASVATAAIAEKVIPGSFFGMNKIGDCMFGTSTAAYQNCGVDINVTGHGATCPDNTSIQAYLCAPKGIVLASICNGTAQAGCGTSPTGNGSNYAGNSGTVWGGPAVGVGVSGAAGGLTIVSSPTVLGGAATTDPFQGKPQPPLSVPGVGGAPQAIPSCGLSDANLATITSATQLGPYQYYHYSTLSGGKPVPDGVQLSIPAGSFAKSAGCPGTLSAGGTSQASSAFPAYIFYGGLAAGNSVTLGPGQYVMAGVNATGTQIMSGALTGDTSVGTMLILSNANYPGLSTQLTTVPNSGSMATTYQYQGDVDLKNTSLTLTGFNKDNLSTAIPALDDYDTIVLWQDRANSTVEYNKAGPTPACSICTKDDGTVVACGMTCGTNHASQAMYTENGVWATNKNGASPQFALNHGNGTTALNGTLYQPRGAWIEMASGTAQISNSKLIILTGMIDGGGGNSATTLTSPTTSLITYVPALIQ